MLTENKVRSQIETVWSSGDSPIRKARSFLAIERQIRRVAARLVNLGSTAHLNHDEARARRLWSAAAMFLALAGRAREDAHRALKGRGPRLGFDVSPMLYADPQWRTEAR